jgi:hypothetical protein
MRRIREKDTGSARRVMVGDASAVEVPSRFVLWRQGKQLVHPDSQQHHSAAQLSNLQLGKICRFEARLGLAGANNNSSNQSAGDLPTKKSLRV